MQGRVGGRKLGVWDPLRERRENGMGGIGGRTVSLSSALESGMGMG